MIPLLIAAGATTTARDAMLSTSAVPPAVSLSVNTNVAAIPVAVRLVTCAVASVMAAVRPDLLLKQLL